MNTAEWKHEWPSKPGWYWFYGVIGSSDSLGEQARLYPVCVSEIGEGKGKHPIYVTESQFLYPPTKGPRSKATQRGVWLPLPIPEAPQGIDTCEGPGRCHADWTWCARCGCVGEKFPRRNPNFIVDKVCHLPECEFHPRKLKR
jgi:hypothetical protein